MDEAKRQEVLEKIVQMRRLAQEVKETAGIPSIEAFMRNSDVYCMWAQWFLGEGDLQVEAK
ncbi:MAG: hypothetical protein D9V47_08400 [Clostridia bacterium]|nr:MAG: hypothetical protein D9V47_08400 [Clostridia bacterium]